MQRIQDLKRQQAQKVKERQRNLMSKSPSRLEMLPKSRGVSNNVSPITKKNQQDKIAAIY